MVAVGEDTVRCTHPAVFVLRAITSERKLNHCRLAARQIICRPLAKRSRAYGIGCGSSNEERCGFKSRSDSRGFKSILLYFSNVRRSLEIPGNPLAPASVGASIAAVQAHGPSRYLSANCGNDCGETQCRVQGGKETRSRLVPPSPGPARPGRSRRPCEQGQSCR